MINWKQAAAAAVVAAVPLAINWVAPQQVTPASSSSARVSLDSRSAVTLQVAPCDLDTKSCDRDVLQIGGTSRAGYYYVLVPRGYKAVRLGGKRTITAGGWEDSRYLWSSATYRTFTA